MIWNTELINKLLVRYENSNNVKYITRDFKIESILSDDNENIIFPFLVNQIGDNFKFARKPDIKFEYTKEEYENIQNLKLKPISIIEHLNVIDDNLQNFINCYKNNKSILIDEYLKFETNPIIICILQFLLTNENSNIKIISPNFTSFSEFRRDILSKNYNLPYYMQLGILSSRNEHISFENGCTIDFFYNRKDINEITKSDFLYMGDFKQYTHYHKNLVEDQFIKNENLIFITNTQYLEWSLLSENPKLNKCHIFNTNKKYS